MALLQTQNPEVGGCLVIAAIGVDVGYVVPILYLANLDPADHKTNDACTHLQYCKYLFEPHTGHCSHPGRLTEGEEGDEGNPCKDCTQYNSYNACTVEGKETVKYTGDVVIAY